MNRFYWRSFKKSEQVGLVRSPIDFLVEPPLYMGNPGSPVTGNSPGTSDSGRGASIKKSGRFGVADDGMGGTHG